MVQYVQKYETSNNLLGPKFNEAISFLNRLSPVPALTWNKALLRMALSAVSQMKANITKGLTVGTPIIDLNNIGSTGSDPSFGYNFVPFSDEGSIEEAVEVELASNFATGIGFTSMILDKAQLYGALAADTSIKPGKFVGALMLSTVQLYVNMFTCP